MKLDKMKGKDIMFSGFMSFLVFGASLLTCSVSYGEIILEDSFERLGFLDKTSPSKINFQDGAWGDNAVIGGGKGMRTSRNGLVIDNQNDFVFFPYAFADASAREKFSLSADVVLKKGAGKSWIAIGFAGTNDMFGSGVAWMKLSTDGGVEVVEGPGYINGKHINLPTGVDLEKGLIVRVDYELATNHATFYMNGDAVETIQVPASALLDRIFFATSAADEDLLSGFVRNIKLEELSE